jgi:chondroitin AC lyase
MKPDGSWPDIDYTDRTRGAWPRTDHLVRLNSLAVMYTRKKGDKALGKILLGLDY